MEVFHEGTWGTVCDNIWDASDAEVACRQLGYAGVTTAHKYYGEGSGDIWLSDVHCRGSENSLDECIHSGWGSHDCSHSSDVGIRCTGNATKSSKLSLSFEKKKSLRNLYLSCFIVLFVYVKSLEADFRVKFQKFFWL